MMKRQRQYGTKTLTDDAREAAGACPVLNLRRASRLATNYLEARLRQTGLGVAQFGLMAEVAGAEDDTIGGLAARIGLDQSTMSRNLQGLARLGLVEIAQVEKDLRRRAVWLTEAGARKLETALPVWRAAQRELRTAIPAGQAQRMAKEAAGLSPGGQRK
jgi:DNA-binding MarR family transcriptional regulator